MPIPRFRDCLPAQTAILNKNADILDVNAAWSSSAEQNGYNGPQFLETNYLDVCKRVNGVEKTYADAFCKGFHSVVQGSQDHFEMSYPCHSSTVHRWFLGMIFPQGDSIAVSHIDISGVMRAFGTVNGSLSFSEFVSQLRQPLNIVHGYGQMINGNLEPERTQARVESIAEAAEQMLTIVDDFVSTLENEDGHAAILGERCDASELAQKVVKLLKSKAETHAITLNNQIRGSAFIQVDRHRMLQILLHLIGGAITYSGLGSKVTLSLRINGSNGTEIWLSDDGNGIPEHIVGVMLAPIYRSTNEPVEPPDRAEQGLITAKRLIDLHGGNLKIDNRPGFGTTFKIILPSWRTVV